MLNGLRVQTAAGQNGNAVLGFRCRLIQQPLALFNGLVKLLGHRLQHLDALPDIFQDIDHPQKCRYLHNLGSVYLDAAAGRLLQKLTRR